MSLNCRPGDLAIVVKSVENVNTGRIVTCVKPVVYTFSGLGTVAAWETEPMMQNSFQRLVPCPDNWLRPIRDPGDDAVDETLNWLPVPTKEHA